MTNANTPLSESELSESYDDIEFERALNAYGRMDAERRDILTNQIIQIEQMPVTTFRDSDGVDVIAHRSDDETIFVLRRDFSPALQITAKELNPTAAFVMIKVKQ